MMIIPDPITQPVSYDLSSLPWYKRLSFVCSHPPQVKLMADYIITMPDWLQIVMPTGFVTDFASVPRMFWSVPGFSPSGPLLWGSVPHDFGYQHQYLLAVKSDIAMEHVNSIGRVLMRKYPDKFVDVVPVYAGESQEFFDQLLYDITIQKTGAAFVAGTARWVLNRYGDRAWKNYRIKGPAAYNSNSLGYPGLTYNKVVARQDSNNINLRLSMV